MCENRLERLTNRTPWNPWNLWNPLGTCIFVAAMSMLIKNGTIVTATDQYVGDVFVEGDKITTIGSALSMPADRVIDAKGKYVLPGGIDVHTHMDMPFGGTTSADDFESGTIAAAFGGTTTIVDFAIQYKGRDAASRVGNVDEEGRRQGRDRLRLPHDHHGALRSGRDRDGRDGQAGRHAHSSCSWHIPASSCSTMPASFGRCGGRARTAARSACTPRTAA